MTMQRRSLTRAAALAVAALALAAPLAACSDDEDTDTTTESSEPATDTSAATDETMGDDEMSDDTMAEDEVEEEASSGEVGTTELLEYLNAEDPAIGALFDWNTGDGVIAINYMGVQTVGLYAVDIDVATATAACELASEYVLEVDDTAAIEVYTGGYDTATLVVSRTGADGTCTAA